MFYGEETWGEQREQVGSHSDGAGPGLRLGCGGRGLGSKYTLKVKPRRFANGLVIG